jgi:hypothetical protein
MTEKYRDPFSTHARSKVRNAASAAPIAQVYTEGVMSDAEAKDVPS